MTSDQKKARRAAYMREWNRRNPEKVRAAQAAARAKRDPQAQAAYNRDYYLRHAEAIKAKRSAAYVPRPKQERTRKSAQERRQQVREWHYSNHESRLAQKRAWSAANRDKGAAYAAARRARLRQATPSWACGFFIGEAYHLARVRSAVTGMKWEVDHIVPLISDLVCGLHVVQYLRVIPRGANRSKGNWVWPDMP